IYGKIDSIKGGAVGINVDDGTGDSSVDTTSTVGEQPFNIVLLHQKLIPLGRFFAIGHDSPEARNPLGNNLWAKQAYLFVHFCLFGENLRYKDSLALFVQQLAHEPLSEDLFKKCFKVGYADMEKQLRGYILNTRHKYQKYTLDPANKLDSQAIDLSDATPATVGLIKGDALRLAGKSAAAVAEYRTAYARGAREPALLAGYGEAELALGNKDRAHALLDAASQAGVDRPSAYVRLAELRLADGKASPRGPNGQLDSGQVGAVLTPLFKARNFPPPLPETYKLIAETWSVSAVQPSVGNLAVLDEGIRKFPRQSPLLYQSAQLYQRIGQNEQAASIARLGIRFPADATAKAQFEQLLATLPPPPANPTK
ncbi:MAG TPA: hypothetical protein VFJ90_12850, partial [Candidatus Didemnitutus sp.]|nr:hypothetical protein [Candidatus Didemnitutus sp.]